MNTPGMSPPPPEGGSPLRFLVGALCAVAAVGWLTFTSFDAQVYYVTVAELQEEPERWVDREFRVKGDVLSGSHYVREGTLDEHRFVLVEDGRRLQVNFHGILPDTFTDTAEVVALGRAQADGTFLATEVMAKCASRYEESAPTAAGRPGSAPAY